MGRRKFLVLSGASVGGVIVCSLDRKAFRLAAQDKPAQSIKIPLKFFSQEEALILAAAASRIFHTDDTGPGASEAGYGEVGGDRQGHWRERNQSDPGLRALRLAALPVHAGVGRHDHRAVS
jgi:hypothetical protein